MIYIFGAFIMVIIFTAFSEWSLAREAMRLNEKLDEEMAKFMAHEIVDLRKRQAKNESA